MTATSDDSAVEGLIALSGLNGAGPARLRWLSQHDDPEVIVRMLIEAEGNLIAALHARWTDHARDAVPRGLNPELLRRWAAELRAIDQRTPIGSGELLARHSSRGITVLSPADPRWPFHADPEPPAVLFVRGDLDALGHRHRVAIVGTRRCSSVGRAVATEMGAQLAAAGVAVISGLALGIDGAAHRGVLSVERSAPPVGVLANGFDTMSPASHRDLAEQIAARGALITEAPLGAPAARWRFPARNRLIAGLAQGVLIVESHSSGGALITVDEAHARGLSVLAVPGSVRSPASVGTNELIRAGAEVVLDPDDVLLSLGVPHGQGQLLGLESADHRQVPTPRELSTPAAWVLHTIAAGPCALDALADSYSREHPGANATSLDPASVSLNTVIMALSELIAHGLAILDGSSVRRMEPS